FHGKHPGPLPKEKPLHWPAFTPAASAPRRRSSGWFCHRPTHLTLRGLTPEAYRAKWDLPADYPMTTANYSAQRSALAHSFGLGQKRRKTASTAVE
ncbi:hypothetical protein FV227_26030, partial [Methylobacterium sp. WL119]